MNLHSYIQEIENFLSEGDTESACEGLLNLLEGNDADLKAQIILLMGQYKEIRRNQALAIDNDKQGINRINNALIKTSNEIKNNHASIVISPDVQQKLAHLRKKSYANDTPSVSASKTNWRQWLTIAGVVLIAFVGWRIYNWVSSAFSSGKDDIVQLDKKMGKNDITSNNTQESSSSSSNPTTLPEQKPTYLDVQGKSQGFEIVETKYFPAEGMSRLVFRGKFFCKLGNPGGCGYGNTNFQLLVDGTEKELEYNNLKDDRASNYGNGLINSNSHQFVEFFFDFPATAQSVSLIIKISGKTTIPIDFKKIIPTPPSPKLIELTAEKDLNITKNFGNSYQLLSVKAQPFDDTYLKLIVRLSKCPSSGGTDCDFYDQCVRVVADNGATLYGCSFGETKTIAENNQRIEKEYEIMVSRTAQSPELMVGNCWTGKTPFKVALPF